MRELGRDQGILKEEGSFGDLMNIMYLYQFHKPTLPTSLHLLEPLTTQLNTNYFKRLQGDKEIKALKGVLDATQLKYELLKQDGDSIIHLRITEP